MNYLMKLASTFQKVLGANKSALELLADLFDDQIVGIYGNRLEIIRSSKFDDSFEMVQKRLIEFGCRRYEADTETAEESVYWFIWNNIEYHLLVSGEDNTVEIVVADAGTA
jgi:hypothetical protein